MLIEDGTLHKLKTKWWKDKGECSDAEVIFQAFLMSILI